MKKDLKRLLCLLTFTALFVCISGCNVVNQDDDYVLQIDYIESLAAQIGDATAIGISKMPINSVTDLSFNSNNHTDNEVIASLFSPEFLANTTTAQAPEEKNYLVVTTEDYFNGKTEYDETGITKVTFIKNTTVTETVRDSKGNIISETDTVTQDEIPAQVNKFYSYNNFTFIEFIPVTPNNEGILSLDGEQMVDIRPDNLIMKEDGTTEFDTVNYKTNDYHQSFVIDNTTGYIYKIAEIEIWRIHNGLCQINDDETVHNETNDNVIYDYRINEDGQLEFFTLIQNPTVMVYDFFKDVYGNNFIYTDSLDTYDATTGTYFYEMDGYSYGPTSDKFVYTDKHIVLVKIADHEYQKVVADGQFAAISPDDTFTCEGNITAKNGKLYVVPVIGKLPIWTYGPDISITDLVTGKNVSVTIFYHSNSLDDTYFLVSNDVLLFRNDYAMYWCRIDFSDIDFDSMEGRLIYFPDIITISSGDVMSNAAGSNEETGYYPIESMTTGWSKLYYGEGYNQVTWDNYFNYELIGINQTRYFEVIKVYNETNFNLSLIEKASVDAGETVRYFFQPINPH